VVSEIDWWDFFFKKTIHVFEYGILFVLLYRSLNNTSRIAIKKLAVWAFFLTVFYAATDEFHQTFVRGRTGTLRDVLIDSSGAGLFWLGISKYLSKAPEKIKSLCEKINII